MTTQVDNQAVPPELQWTNRTKYIPEEEWRDIPLEGLEYYQASSLGRIRLKETGDIASHWLSDGRYVYVSILRPEKTQYRVNRLICATFEPIEERDPLSIYKDNIPFEAHHKNHKITDNRASNLTWLTGSDNQLAYIESGKCPTNIRVRLIDTASNTSRDFDSVKQLSKFLDMHDKTVDKYINSPVDRLIDGRYKAIVLDDSKIGLAVTNKSIDIIYYDYVKGQEVTMATMAHAQKITGVTTDIIAARIKADDDKLTAGYVFRRCSTETVRPWPEFSQEEILRSRNFYIQALSDSKRVCSSKPVQVYIIAEDKLMEHPSLRDAVAFHGDDYIRTSKLINHKGSKLYRFDGKVYRLIGDNRSLTDTDLYVSKVGYIAKNYSTGEIVLFDRNPDVRAKFNDYPDNIFRAQNPKTSPRRLIKGWWLQTQNESGEYNWPEFTEDEIKASLTYKRYPGFIGRNYETGEIRVIETASDVKDLLGRAPTAVFEYINHPKFPPRLINNWYIKKEGDGQEWPKILGF